MFKTPVSPTPTSDGAFPDKVDAQTPFIGYMPGHMPWRFGERFEALGVEIINTKAAGGPSAWIGSISPRTRPCSVRGRRLTGAAEQGK